MSSGASDSGESNFRGFPILGDIMQGFCCMISTTHGLGTTFGKGLMCLCQICAELLSTFYFFTNYWQVGPPASFPIKCSSLEWNAISSHIFRQFCIDALNPLPYDPYALIRCH